MHHSFNIDIAERFGLEEAILIHHFQHWISINKRLGRHLIDGKTWTYQTAKWIAAHFPYFKNRHKVERTIKKLVDVGVLITANYNNIKFDQTKWYAFKDEDLFIKGVKSDPELHDNPEETEDEKSNTQKWPSESAQSNVQKCAMGSEKARNEQRGSAQPIPDTITNTKTHMSLFCSVLGEKKLSDNESKKLSDEEVVFKVNQKNESLEVDKSNILRRAVREGENWTLPEIEEAWEAFRNYPNSVSDPYRFIKGIIRNIRDNKKKIERLNSKNTYKPKNNMEAKCTMKKPIVRDSSKETSSDSNSRESLLDVLNRRKEEEKNSLRDSANGFKTQNTSSSTQEDTA